MRVITGSDTVDTMLLMYSTVKRAPETSARGMKTRNVHNMAVVFDASDAPITSFAHRKMNLPYAKKEWLWYLGADPKDDSIEQHATLWAKIKQPDGSYFSNYGQYIFGKEIVPEFEHGPNGELAAKPSGEFADSQFEYVLKTLREDVTSRRASMVLLKMEHLFTENKDVVCTYGINFTVEAKKLNMTVMMRSNDVIYGFTNDAFCFSQLYNLVFAVLRHYVPDLRYGTYTHFTNSMHVYEKHYQMISDILVMGRKGYVPIEVPPISAREAMALVKSKGKEGTGKYWEWLNQE